MMIVPTDKFPRKRDIVTSAVKRPKFVSVELAGKDKTICLFDIRIPETLIPGPEIPNSEIVCAQIY